MEPSQAPLSRVTIQAADFDLNAEIAALRAQDPRVGAVCSFVGTVRDHTAGTAGRISSMELEHYPGMTEKAIEAMIDEAQQRFDIYATRVIHRIGLLQPLDQAPFWKKEQTPDGARWVDARVSDDNALARWGILANNS